MGIPLQAEGELKSLAPQGESLFGVEDCGSSSRSWGLSRPFTSHRQSSHII